MASECLGFMASEFLSCRLTDKSCQPIPSRCGPKSLRKRHGPDFECPKA